MSNVYAGVGISFGTSGTTINTISGYFQSIDHEYKSDMDEVRDGGGNIQEVTFYNQVEEAQFEYVTTASSGGANSPSLPAIGAKLTVADTTTDTNIAGTSWYVTNVNKKRSNTQALRVTLKLTKWPNIS